MVMEHKEYLVLPLNLDILQRTLLFKWDSNTPKKSLLMVLMKTTLKLRPIELMLHMPVQCTLKTLIMKSKLSLLKTWLLSWVMLVKLELMKTWMLWFYWKIDITYVMKTKWESMLKSLAYLPVITFLIVQWWIKTNSLRPLHLTSLLMLILVISVTHTIVLLSHKELSLNQVFIKLMFISLIKILLQTI